MVAKKLLEILPLYGFLIFIGSDNGFTFVYQVSQGSANIWGIDWKVRCAYSSQHSGQVEKTNKTLKEITKKMSMEYLCKGTLREIIGIAKELNHCILYEGRDMEWGKVLFKS